MSKGKDATTSSTRTFITPSTQSKPAKKISGGPGSGSKKLPWLIVLVMVATSVFLVVQYRDAKDKLQTTAPSTANHQVADTVTRVSKLIILPKNETPTIITVKDASKLKGEQFYADAQNGDITLVYSKEKRAILYRPSANVIVNVANVTITPTK